MELKEEMVSQQTVYEGIIVNVRRDKARLLDGRIANREVVEHPGGVAVLPWTGRGAGWRWSASSVTPGRGDPGLPAGKLEPGEDPRASGLRELAETGTDPGDLPASGQHRLPPGILAERIHLFFLARDLVQGRPAPMTGSLWRPSGFPTRICWTWPAGERFRMERPWRGILKASFLLEAPQT